MYSLDFEPANATYIPVEDTLLLGVSPLLAVTVLALILAVGAGMYLLGRAQIGAPGSGDSDKAPKEIYAVILRYSAAARSASSNELKQKAEELERKVDQYLGAVLLIGKDVGGHVKDLKKAIGGMVEDDEKPTPPKTHAAPCICGGQAAKGCGCGAGHGGTVAVQPLSINQIYIGGAPATLAPAGESHDAPAGGHPPEKAQKPSDKTQPKPERPMTLKEQVEALDKAVRGFNDYWLIKEKRVQELQDARKALNTRPSSRDIDPKNQTASWF